VEDKPGNSINIRKADSCAKRGLTYKTAKKRKGKILVIGGGLSHKTCPFLGFKKVKLTERGKMNPERESVSTEWN